MCGADFGVRLGRDISEVFSRAGGNVVAVQPSSGLTISVGKFRINLNLTHGITRELIN